MFTRIPCACYDKCYPRFATSSPGSLTRSRRACRRHPQKPFPTVVLKHRSIPDSDALPVATSTFEHWTAVFR